MPASKRKSRTSACLNPSPLQTMPAAHKSLLVIAALLGCSHLVVAPSQSASVETSEQWLARVRCAEGDGGSWTWAAPNSQCEMKCAAHRIAYISLDGGNCVVHREAAEREQSKWKWTYECSVGRTVPSRRDGDCIWICEEGQMRSTDNDGGVCPFTRPDPGQPSAI